MGKNKKRAAGKKRQQRALKSRRRRKAHRVRPKQARLPAGAFPEQERVFWIAHGVNFLHSDWDQAIWNPMFPEAYTSPENLSFDLISERLVPIAEVAIEKMSGAQRAVLGYAFQEEVAHYAFKKEAERRLEEKGVEDPVSSAKLPHQSTVWQLFHDKILVTALQRAEGHNAE